MTRRVLVAAEVVAFWPWIAAGALMRKALPSQEAFERVPQVARGLAYAAGEME